MLSRGSFDHEKLDAHSADLVALFEYMIGNTDWSIVRERNIVLLQDSSGLLQPLPFDFDMSGLVDAHYAGPAPGLSIDQVTERHTTWDFAIRIQTGMPCSHTFLDKQETMLSMVAEIPGLKKQSTRVANRFLERFFNILQLQ